MYNIPSFDDWFAAVGRLRDEAQGLILVHAGWSRQDDLGGGHVDLINRKRQANIITLEDPIEYLYKPLKCNVNQREIGTATDSFSEGLRRIFRRPRMSSLWVKCAITRPLKAPCEPPPPVIWCSAPCMALTSAIDGMVNGFQPFADAVDISRRAADPSVSA
jgi:hypothetical protein